MCRKAKQNVVYHIIPFMWNSGTNLLWKESDQWLPAADVMEAD